MAQSPTVGPAASRVLARLSDAISDLARASDLEIRLGDAAGSGPPALVGADGAVVASVHALGGDDVTTQAIGALLDAYAFVLDAERARRRADLRLEQFRHDARTDALTGLLNSHGWDEAVLREQARCARSPRPVAVVVVDLQDLERTTREYGELAGDMLLRLTAGVLREAVRTSDVVARPGAEEFALLLLDHTEHEVATITARIEAVLAAECIDAAVGGAIGSRGDRVDELFHSARGAIRKRAHDHA